MILKNGEWSNIPFFISPRPSQVGKAVLGKKMKYLSKNLYFQIFLPENVGRGYLFLGIAAAELKLLGDIILRVICAFYM